MASNYTFVEKIVLGVYKLIFRDSNISLKKYSRNVYMVGILLLAINIASIWFFGQYEEFVRSALNMAGDSYGSFTDNFNITVNFLEVGFGLVGAFLDFTPSENKA